MGFSCGSCKVIKNYVCGEKALNKHSFREKKEEDEQFLTKKINQETDFNLVKINTAHFDTVKCKCFSSENLKGSWKRSYFFKGTQSPGAHAH